MVSHIDSGRQKVKTVRNNYDDVAGARRVECGEAQQVASSLLREPPGLDRQCHRESLEGLTAEEVVVGVRNMKWDIHLLCRVCTSRSTVEPH